MLVVSSHAQDHQWAFGFYGDVLLESPDYSGSFGIQAKCDLTQRQSLQAQVHGRTGFVSVGADYLVSVLNKTNSNWNVFLGAGVAEEFYSAEGNDEYGVGPVKVRDRQFVGNAQVGFSYYIPSVKLSVYSAYKLKYGFEADAIDPNYLALGVRYHLW